MTGGIEGAPDDSPRAQSSLEDAERSLEEAKDSLWAARVADAQTLEERFTLLLDVLTRNAAYGAWSTLSAETNLRSKVARGVLPTSTPYARHDFGCMPISACARTVAGDG